MFIKILTLGPFLTNCYVLKTENECIVIDPADEAERILEEIGGLKAKLIIATHGHPDHIGAVSELRKETGALFLIHEKEIETINQTSKLFFPILSISPPTPDLLIKDGDEIKIGGIILKVIHTPGHSPGSICLLGKGFVFCGDTLFMGGIGRYDLPGGSFEQILESIRAKLLSLPENTNVYPGHGPPTTIGDEKILNPFLKCLPF